MCIDQGEIPLWVNRWEPHYLRDNQIGPNLPLSQFKAPLPQHKRCWEATITLNSKRYLSLLQSVRTRLKLHTFIIYRNRFSSPSLKMSGRILSPLSKRGMISSLEQITTILQILAVSLHMADLLKLGMRKRALLINKLKNRRGCQHLISIAPNRPERSLSAATCSKYSLKSGGFQWN